MNSCISAVSSPRTASRVDMAASSVPLLFLRRNPSTTQPLLDSRQEKPQGSVEHQTKLQNCIIPPDSVLSFVESAHAFSGPICKERSAGRALAWPDKGPGGFWPTLRNGRARNRRRRGSLSSQRGEAAEEAVGAQRTGRNSSSSNRRILEAADAFLTFPLPAPSASSLAGPPAS